VQASLANRGMTFLMALPNKTLLMPVGFSLELNMSFELIYVATGSYDVLLSHKQAKSRFEWVITKNKFN
jgi:hypothetical protein